MEKLSGQNSNGLGVRTKLPNGHKREVINGIREVGCFVVKKTGGNKKTEAENKN